MLGWLFCCSNSSCSRITSYREVAFPFCNPLSFSTLAPGKPIANLGAMMKWRRWTAAIFVLGLSPSARAQQILTLSDFLAKVEKNNPEIVAGKKEVLAKEAMRKAAGAWEDPMGMFGVMRMPTTSVASGTLIEGKLYAKEFGVTQKFPFFGTLRQKKNIAAQDKLASEFGLKQTTLERRAEAKQAYYDWARAQREKQFLERVEGIWQNLVSFTETRYAQAEGEHHEYLRAQVELKKVQSEQLENAQNLAQSAALLSYLAGENLAADKLTAEPLPEELPPALPADSILRLTSAQNPEIGKFAALQEKVRFEKNLTAKGYYPDFDLSIYRTQQIDNFMPTRLMNVYGARLSLRLPLFFWTTRSREVQAKAFEFESAGFMRRNVENQKRAEAASLSAEVSRLENQIHLYKDELLPRARFLVEESQTAYTVGKMSFPDFAQGQLEQIDLERNYIGLLADFWKAVAELEKTTGKEEL